MTLDEIIEYMLSSVPDEYDVSVGSFFMTFFTLWRSRYIFCRTEWQDYLKTHLH